jgi:hypothetical protein
VVVTMFSISELARASRSGNVLISIPWLGMSSAACLSSARAVRAVIHRLRTALVSKSTARGNSGRALYGTSALQGTPVMIKFSRSIDTFRCYVDVTNTSTETCRDFKILSTYYQHMSSPTTFARFGARTKKHAHPRLQPPRHSRASSTAKNICRIEPLVVSEKKTSQWGIGSAHEEQFIWLRAR